MLLTSDLVGKPFKDGGRGPGAFDCWGLAVEVFRRFGIEIPDYRISCESVNTGVMCKREQWAPCIGEIPSPALVVFTTAGITDHIGVYLGAGKFIHAHRSAGVVVTGVDHVFWKRRIEGFYVPGWLP
ncbi:MAG: C40 family peptidase [Negativicutes bacterium]|nr:C40 family peptidase [Negativicutes bacterium]